VAPRIALAVGFLALLAAVVGGVEVASHGHSRWYAVVLGGLCAVVYWPLALNLLARRYGPERTEHHLARAYQRRDWYRGWVLVYVLPVFAAVMFALTVVSLGPAWAAAHGGGRPGVLTIEVACAKRDCARGQFRSDDGSVVRDNVTMHDSAPVGRPVGDRVRARDTGDEGGVFAETGSDTWLLIGGVAAASGGFLLCWAGWLLYPRRRPGRARHLSIVD